MGAAHSNRADGWRSLTLGELPVTDCEPLIRRAAEEITYHAAGQNFKSDPPSEWFAELEDELVRAMIAAAAKVTMRPPVVYRVGRERIA